ncbi:MAG: hypothetical protein GX776_09065 [Oxalobacter sp.]|nr:hypothetical protein [Oxalobacter sp.]
MKKIKTLEEANAYAEEFIQIYNMKFAKEPRHSNDAHRPLRDDEDLDLIFTWREQRCVSKRLTIQYDKKLYLFEDNETTRRLIGHYIDVYHYPDGRIEPRANNTPLPFVIYDRLSEIDQGAIVENKRLGHVLQLAQAVQEKRENRRSQAGPTSIEAPRRRGKTPGKKSQRALDDNDVLEAWQQLQQCA